MSLVNDALQAALKEYDRPDLETDVTRRIRRALFELHGVALFPQDLTVSSLVATTTSPQTLSVPADMRFFNRIIAWDGTEEMAAEFQESSVINPVDYFNFSIPKYFLRRGSSIIVGYKDIAPSHLSIEYYKFPSFDAETLATDSWIVATDYTILQNKLCAIVAKLAGKNDDIRGWEASVLSALDAISGA